MSTLIANKRSKIYSIVYCNASADPSSGDKSVDTCFGVFSLTDGPVATLKRARGNPMKLASFASNQPFAATTSAASLVLYRLCVPDEKIELSIFDYEK